MELVIETGDAPMPRSRPVKRLSEGELAELRAQLVDLLDRGWIQHSTAGHVASVVFARKPDGMPDGASPTGGSATITVALTLSPGPRWNRFRTLMRCSMVRGVQASSPSSTWPAAITN